MLAEAAVMLLLVVPDPTLQLPVDQLMAPQHFRLLLVPVEAPEASTAVASAVRGEVLFEWLYPEVFYSREASPRTVTMRPLRFAVVAGPAVQSTSQYPV